MEYIRTANVKYQNIFFRFKYQNINREEMMEKNATLHNEKLSLFIGSLALFTRKLVNQDHLNCVTDILGDYANHSSQA